MKQSHLMKPKHAIAVASALLAIVTAPASATPAETESTPYVMTVISDAAHGRRVTAGKYSQAIQKITHGGQRTRARFADQNNLCVAYAKTVELDKAAAACEAAIAQLKKKEPRILRKSSVIGGQLDAYRSDLSVALSNRGVLRAVAGKTELARQDFNAAIELRSRVSRIAEENLDRLEQAELPGA